MSKQNKKQVHWHWVALRAVLLAVPCLLMLVGEKAEKVADYLNARLPRAVTRK